MTPMIDMVFNLIIFFVVVSRFISAENVAVELPDPENSLARHLEFPDRVVLNCRRTAGGEIGESPARYDLGPISVENLAELEQRLRAVKVERPGVEVIIRADRRIAYEHIRGAMKAVAAAGIGNMNIAAEIED